jgi:signal recognition particle receptor subunit beta
MSYLEEEVIEEKELIDEVEKSDSGSKVLFIGLSQSGKTSINQVVFEGREPSQTEQLHATVRFSRKKVEFSDLTLFIFDVGGQTPYLEEIFETQRSNVFSNVKALFYVVDAANFGAFHTSQSYFIRTIRTINELNKDTKICVLAHKMDLIPNEERNSTVQNISDIFSLEKLEGIEIFQTSIYEDSITDVMENVLLKNLT